MYRAIIVDDEVTVRRGLQNHFNWEKYGIEVVADFPDGQRAWHYLLSNPVDLVVTDVRMPRMDGIALAKAVRARTPKTRLLFISGYEDTEYLRSALKMDAVDYILKSIDLDELAETIARVTAQMEAETSQEQAIAMLEEKLVESIPLLQQRALMLLVQEGLENDHISYERLSYLDIPLRAEADYCVLVLQLRDMWRSFSTVNEHRRLMFTLQFQEGCREILERYGCEVCFENRLGEYVMFLQMYSDDDSEMLLGVAEELRQFLAQRFEFDCRIGISDRFTGLGDAPTAFQGAVNAIHKRYYLGESHSISVDKYEDTVALRSVQDRAEKTIRDALLSGDVARIHSAVEGAYQELDAIQAADEQQNFALALLFLPNQVLANVRAGGRGCYDDHRKLVERFLYCGDLREQKLFLLSCYEEVAGIINSRSEAHSHHIIERVQRIIQERYMEQLSIAAIAEEVYLTPTYLCVLFKQATGQTINEAITGTRIRRAKDLLANPHIKLYDVCYQVGYLSPSYFSKLFKKTTHMTPSEYRETSLPQKRHEEE